MTLKELRRSKGLNQSECAIDLGEYRTDVVTGENLQMLIRKAAGYQNRD